MMKALSLMQWLVSWGHCLILETRLCRTLVDGPVAEMDKDIKKELIKEITVCTMLLHQYVKPNNL